MTLTQIGLSYRWHQAVPKALQSRFNCGRDIARMLTTRDRTLAHSFATYLTETALRMFTLAAFHPELNSRELGLLVRNLKKLTEIVEIHDGERSPSKYFTLELEHLVTERKQRLPSRRLLLSLQGQMRSLSEEFERGFGLADQKPEDRSSKLMSEVMLLFLHERKQNWKAHTVQLKRACLRALLSIIGDLRMDHITRSDLAHFKEVVQLLPVRWEHMYPGVPIAEVITKEHSGPKLRPGTVNGYLIMAHGFFEWAYVHGYIATNPARKLKISLKNRVRDQRSRLYATDLRLIFEESLFFSRKSAPAAIAARKIDLSMYHIFWIPLIALYSGMRASEIVGLERQDICREDGVWCFRVRPNGLRDIKSLCSNRSVPMHPALLKMGFLDSIAHQGFGPRQNIWPNLSKHASSYGGGLSRIWSRYKRNSGIDDVHKTFHSFRHTFIHALADADSQVDVVAEIAGHSMKSEFYGRYRKRPDLKRLLKTVRRVVFPCQIDHLYA